MKKILLFILVIVGLQAYGQKFVSYQITDSCYLSLEQKDGVNYEFYLPETAIEHNRYGDIILESVTNHITVTTQDQAVIGLTEVILVNARTLCNSSGTINIPTPLPVTLPDSTLVVVTGNIQDTTTHTYLDSLINITDSLLTNIADSIANIELTDSITNVKIIRVRLDGSLAIPAVPFDPDDLGASGVAGNTYTIDYDHYGFAIIWLRGTEQDASFVHNNMGYLAGVESSTAGYSQILPIEEHVKNFIYNTQHNFQANTGAYMEIAIKVPQ